MNPLDLFPGKKTYLLALGAVFTALGAWMTGNIELGQLVEALFAAGAMMTLRKGMK